jgi:putative phosphoribosyl transferase
LRPDADAVVLSLLRGGVPVGESVSRRLRAPLDVAFVRKLPLPMSPEAGFGAVALDGSVVLNRDVINLWGLTNAQIDRVVEEVRAELEARYATYRDACEPAPVKGRTVYLVDDGIASGYTMIAAAKMVRTAHAGRRIVAAPVSPVHSLRQVASLADDVACLIRQTAPSFAVASYYRSFRELPAVEVKTVLQRRERERRNGEATGPEASDAD